MRSSRGTHRVRRTAAPNNDCRDKEPVVIDQYVDLQEIRQKLEVQRTDLLERITKEEAGLHAPVETTPDLFDLAQDYVSKERRSAMLAKSRQQLEQIELALKRLDDGTYGQCGRCGSMISPARLQVLPYATTCVKC